MSKEKEIIEAVLKKEFAKSKLQNFKRKRAKCDKHPKRETWVYIDFILQPQADSLNIQPEEINFSISKKDIEFLLDKKQEELVENVRSYGLQLKKLINE